MAQITIEEVEAAIKNQTAAREQALAQANFHAGCLGVWQELLARLKEPDVAADAIDLALREAFKNDAASSPEIKPVARKRTASKVNGLNLEN